jgi:hypothetical protein
MRHESTTDKRREEKRKEEKERREQKRKRREIGDIVKGSTLTARANKFTALKASMAHPGGPTC